MKLKKKTLLPFSSLLVFIQVIFFLGFNGCAPQSMPPSPEEKALFITTEDIEGLGYALKDPLPPATVQKVIHGDGTLELDFEFDNSDETDQFLYLSHTIQAEKSAKDALFLFNTESMAISWLVNSEESSNRSIDSLYKFGDRSSFRLLLNSNGPIGNVFTSQVGNCVISFIVIGIPFEAENLEDWKILVESKFNRIAEKYRDWPR